MSTARPKMSARPTDAMKKGMSFRTTMKTAFRSDDTGTTDDSSDAVVGALKKGLSFRTTVKEAFKQQEEEKTKETEEAIKAHFEVMKKVEETFPGAIKSLTLAEKVDIILGGAGYDEETTLMATSLCCDEVNRDLENDLRELYGVNFSMGGLAGFAFGGVTSFGAMAHHIPESGSCLILYGPHVGVDLDLKVGKVNRRGRKGSGACCGSANAAAAYVKMVRDGERSVLANPDDILDAQQVWVGAKLLPYSDRLAKAEDPDVELPLSLFDAQDELMLRIVEKGCGEVAGNGKIALLGGIQVNTPEGCPEYFVPKRFEVRNNKGEVVEDLLGKLLTMNGGVGRMTSLSKSGGKEQQNGHLETLAE